MEIKQLTNDNIDEFCALIVNMYAHLENLEWFSPMPYDHESVKNMINKDRFYIVGAFENNKLIAVGSLDYKCGKLIGKINFPKGCNTDKLVETGFTMVHSDYRGRGIMKVLLAHLLEKIAIDGYEWAFGKVHKDNFASSKSLIKKGFEIFEPYSKPVNKEEFIALASQNFFSKIGKENAEKTLQKFKEQENIIVDYNILVKKI
jgi:GNAT superfamily N-acetyltransferase